MFVNNFDPNLVKGCLVTSYDQSIKFITIDLYKSGISAEILKKLQPKIIVSELVSHRSDCASIYKMKCLLSNSEIDLSNFIEVFNQSDVTSKRYFRIKFKQWQVQDWHKNELIFEHYPLDVQYLIILCSGNDLQYWAGEYGSKMANCSAVVTTDCNI